MSDERAQAETYAREAQRLRDAGNHYEALIRQRRSVALLRDTGDARALAGAIRHLADMLVEAGQPDEAEPAITEMLGLYHSLPDLPHLDMGNALRSAALRAEAINDSDTAWIFWIQARARYALLDEVGERDGAGERDGSGEDAPANPHVAEADAHLKALRG